MTVSRFKSYAAFLKRLRAPSIQQAPLSKLASTGIGPTVWFHVCPQNEDQAFAAADAARAHELPIWIHGMGTKIYFDLPSDPYPGVVISWTHRQKTAFAFDARAATKTRASDEFFALKNTHAGLAKHALFAWLRAHDAPDAVWISGIPGTLAGGIRMNAGTDDGDFSRVVTSITTINLATGARRIRAARPVDFGYRSHDACAPEDLITYCDLKFAAAPADARREMRARVQRALNRRRQTQPLGKRNHGSTFKNPAAPQPPAARLITECGLKGHRIGGAQISPLHANFFVNTGGATGADMTRLIAHARESVACRFGVTLETEVIRVASFIELHAPRPHISRNELGHT